MPMALLILFFLCVWVLQDRPYKQQNTAEVLQSEAKTPIIKYEQKKCLVQLVSFV